MKTKMYVLAALLMASMVNVVAEDKTVIHPSDYPTHETADVTLGNDDSHHLFIGKNKFLSAVPGNIVRVHGWNTGDGAHKMLLGYRVCEGNVFDNNAYLPGGEICDITWTEGCYDFYLTKDMLDAIRYGGPNCGDGSMGRDLRIYGENITVNMVELIQPGLAGSFHEPFKTVWKGLLWVDGEWNSRDINKATLAPYDDFSNVRAIRFYHEANRTNFTLNLILAWDPLTKVADQSNMTLTNEYFELELTDAMRSQLAGIESVLYVQGDKGSGDAFNLTDIVFVTYSPDDCSNCFYVY